MANGFDVLLIASSTGGPTALEVVLTGLNEHLDKPVLIVQHMPPNFTKIFAKALNQKCKLEVLEGSDGESLKNGRAIIAPGDFHMFLKGAYNNIKIGLDQSGPVNCVRPAADVLFKSAAEIFAGRKVLAVVLTGMGSDGTNGVRELKEKCDCYCITQSESSCTIYGMPRSVYEAGLSDEVLDLKLIAGRITELTMRENS